MTSPRAQRLLALLRDRGSKGATTREITRLAEVMNPATLVSQMRKAGFEITASFDHRTDAGSKVFRYTLKETYATPQAK